MCWYGRVSAGVVIIASTIVLMPLAVTGLYAIAAAPKIEVFNSTIFSPESQPYVDWLVYGLGPVVVFCSSLLLAIGMYYFSTGLCEYAKPSKHDAWRDILKCLAKKYEREETEKLYEDDVS